LFIVTCIVFGFLLFNNHEGVIEIFERAGNWGLFGYTIVLSIAVMILLPTPLIKIFAGAIFPLHLAIIVNFAGAMIGGIGAFLFGRWLFREGLVEAIANNPKLQRIDAAIGEESLRISILIRLSPIIPDEWLNYILSAGPVNLKTFSISNCASVVYCIAYAYYGWAFGQIVLQEGGLQSFSESSGAAMMLIGGLVVTILATVIVTRITMQALGDVVGDVEGA
ncbi:MAG: VTT domain-containing protein, partial [Candidatus Poseidoniales archaeon]|nr:VTT domain-containing protein [Candidatus Poseidoniales archaeon]